MRVAVIGGGINGLCSAWKLARQSHSVTVFERDRLMQATSSASSKLLHGGLRYLETGQFRLVREALKERDWWLENVPALAHPLPTIYPVFRGGRRPRWLLGPAFSGYDLLAGKSLLPRSRWLSAREVAVLTPSMRTDGLLGGYLYNDGQMDDYALGMWVAEHCRRFGVDIEENTSVDRVFRSGDLITKCGKQFSFDRIVNVAGPWAQRLLDNSGIPSDYSLDLVRGSHLIIDRPCAHAAVLEVHGEARIVFALPWEGKTLIGTTEVRQSIDEPIACSPREMAYLLDVYNCYFSDGLAPNDIEASFAGVRPLLRSARNPTHASREYALQRNGKLISVFGGKWTTAMALAERVTRMVH